MEIIIYVGMDVHKDNNVVCCYDASTDRFLYEKSMKATTANVLKYLASINKQLGGNVTFICGYEAGPTGFGLYRELQKEGIACVVMAPTSIKHPASYRSKNDWIDARMLAKTLFTKDYSAVTVASEKEEAIKEFCRMRLSLKKQLKTAKQVLLSFLLRMGKKYTDGTTYWTKKHREWLNRVSFDDVYLQESFEEYMLTLNSLESRIKKIERRLEEISQDSAIKHKIDRLVCFSGIDTVTAVSIAAEIGNFDRFRRAFDFVKNLGLVPAEWSSGGSKNGLGITKAGNGYVRKLLIESAKSIKNTSPKGKKSKRLEERQKGMSTDVIAYADRCRYRLKSRMTHLEMKGKHPNVATVAAARELACFIWGMMTNNIA